MKRWIVAGLLVLACPAVAADKPKGRMQACTQQWQAAGRTAPYKAFLKDCLSKPAIAPAAAIKARKVKAVAAKKPKGPNRMPNRMKVCGAQWQKLKAEGATGGQTWREFSRQCLKT